VPTAPDPKIPPRSLASGFWPWLPRREVVTYVRDLWEYVLQQTEHLTNLGERMTSVEDTNYARLRELAGLIKAEFASVRQQLDAAVADKEAAVAAGISSALTEDSANDAARLSGLIDEFGSILPGAPVEVPVPDPGQPAELPTDPPAPADPVVETPAES
jgi:hypothetical protein